MSKVNQTDGDGGGGLAGAPPANIEDPEGPGAKALMSGYEEEPLAESSANFKGRGLAKNDTSPNLKTTRAWRPPLPPLPCTCASCPTLPHAPHCLTALRLTALRPRF